MLKCEVSIFISIGKTFATFVLPVTIICYFKTCVLSCENAPKTKRCSETLSIAAPRIS